MNKGVPGTVLSKVYVPVKVSFDADGNIIPTEITWENGTHYLIDKVTKVRRAAAMRSGGQGDQYTIMVSGRESFLYFERDSNLTGRNLGRWFVARKQSWPIRGIPYLIDFGQKKTRERLRGGAICIETLNATQIRP